MKTKKWGLVTVIGTVLVTVFAVLCMAPLVYMFLLSLTQSDTAYFRLSDVQWDFINYKNVFLSLDNSGLFNGSIWV